MITILAAATTQDKGLVVTLHRGFFSVLLLYSFFLMIWGLFLWLRGRNPSGGYLGALVIIQGVATFQALVGIVLLLQGHRPHEPALHYLYGIAAVVALPAAYFMSAQGKERRDSGVFGLAMLFLVAIALRSASTGGT